MGDRVAMSRNLVLSDEQWAGTGAGVRPSVGTTGICYDNAVSESFFATLKRELAPSSPHHANLNAWPNLPRVRTAVFDYIETDYNRKRIHSTLGYLTPEEYEVAFDKEASNAAQSGVHGNGDALFAARATTSAKSCPPWRQPPRDQPSTNQKVHLTQQRAALGGPAARWAASTRAHFAATRLDSLTIAWGSGMAPYSTKPRGWQEYDR